MASTSSGTCAADTIQNPHHSQQSTSSVIPDNAQIIEKKDADYVGEECSKLGVTVCRLQADLPILIEREKITEAVIIELDQFRIRSKAPLVTTGKWMRLLLGDRCDSKSDRSLTKRAEDMRKRYKGKAKLKYKITAFSFLGERVPDIPLSAPAIQNQLMIKLANTNVNLHKEKTTLTRQLTKNVKKVKTLETSRYEVQSQLRDKKRELTGVRQRIKKTKKADKKKVASMQARLQKRSDALANQEVECRPYNVKRRFVTKDKQIRNLKFENKKLSKQLDEAKKNSKNLKKMTTNFNVLNRTLANKDTLLQKRTRELKTLRTAASLQRIAACKEKKENSKLPRNNSKHLLAQLKELRRTITHLQSDLALAAEEIYLLRDENKPLLKVAPGMFSDNVKLAYMTLASIGVSARRMSQVTEVILSTIGGFDITLDDLPKETYCRERFKDCNSASTIQVAEELSTTKTATLHSDGTSRDGNKVIGFQITTDAGTRTLGLLDVHSGDSATQLEAFNFIMEKLGDVVNDGDTSDVSKELVTRIKNTMGDQAATQKSFNDKLETYRRSILPEVQDQWDQLDDDAQKHLGQMNHFFCNLHTLIGAATYCDAAMKELEITWRNKFGQLGVETLKTFQDKDGNYSWKHTDSAVQRLVRTASDAIAPGGDQKSGCIGGFRSFRLLHDIPRAKVVPFRANRFNVLFSNAAGIFFHRNHIKTMFLEGWVRAENKLLQAVLADIQCEQLLAGVRALGILHKQVTEPFWRLTEQHDVHILDLGKAVQTAYTLLDAWSTDASSLLSEDITPVFKGSEPIWPVKDAVFHELYTEQSDAFNSLTKDVLEAQCTNLKVLFQRRHKDQLDGKYSGELSEELWRETANTKKSNKIGENDLGYWAHIVEMAPSIGVMAAEGKMAYRRNFTSKFLRHLQKNDANKFAKVMKQIRKTTRKWKKRYTQRTASNQQHKVDAITMTKEVHDQKKRRQKRLAVERRKYIEQTGGECRSSEDVNNLEASQISKTRKLESLRKHTTYLKNKYNLTKQIPQPLKSALAFGNQQEKNSVNKLKLNLQNIVNHINAHKLLPNEFHSNEVDAAGDKEKEIEEKSDEVEEGAEESDEESAEESDEESDESEGSESEENMEEYSDWKLADTVAVAFEDGWYLAVVSSIISPEVATVNWMKRHQKGKWGWPTSSIEQSGDVDRKFVFGYGLELIPDASMRFFSLDDSAARDVSRLYNAYFNKYFAS